MKCQSKRSVNFVIIVFTLLLLLIDTIVCECGADKLKCEKNKTEYLVENHTTQNSKPDGNMSNDSSSKQHVIISKYIA